MSRARTMRAYRMPGWGQPPRLQEIPLPEPGLGEVRLKVAGNGICQSDLHMIHDWQACPPHLDITLPMTLGHEVGGWVDTSGPGVAGWAQGCPVLVTLSGCGRCDACLRGWNNYCRARPRQPGIGMDGGLADYVIAPVAGLVPCDGLDPARAAPLTDAGLSSYHAVRRVAGAPECRAGPGPRGDRAMSGGCDRVLITGGAGLLGAALVRHLLAAGGHDITVMDLAETPARLTPLIGQISYLCGDIGHFSHLADAMRASRARRIYHLGALLGFACENDPPEAMRVNAMGAFHVFEAARMFGAQVVFASSVTTFAEGLPEPLLRDDFPQRPVNLYGVLKQIAEGLGRYYRARHGVDFRAIRLPSVIGPGPRLPGLATYSVEMAEAVARGAPSPCAPPPKPRCRWCMCAMPPVRWPSWPGPTRPGSAGAAT